MMKSRDKGRLSSEGLEQLLMQGNHATLPELFDADPTSIRRKITGLTYSADEPLRKAAIEGIRFLSEQRAHLQPDFFREIIRRHIWGMNDEGGNIDHSAPEIIGAVIAGRLDLYREFISILFYTAVAEPFFHESLLAALTMIEKSQAGATGELIELLEAEIRNREFL